MDMARSFVAWMRARHAARCRGCACGGCVLPQRPLRCSDYACGVAYAAADALTVYFMAWGCLGCTFSYTASGFAAFSYTASVPVAASPYTPSPPAAGSTPQRGLRHRQYTAKRPAAPPVHRKAKRDTMRTLGEQHARRLSSDASERRASPFAYADLPCPWRVLRSSPE